MPYDTLTLLRIIKQELKPVSQNTYHHRPLIKIETSLVSETCAHTWKKRLELSFKVRL